MRGAFGTRMNIGLAGGRPALAYAAPEAAVSPSPASLADVPVDRSAATGATIRVLLATRAVLMRRKIRAILGPDPAVSVVTATGGSRTAGAAARRVRPHVMITDAADPDATGRTAEHALPRTGDGARVLVVAHAADPETVRTALQAGAAGFLLADALDLELIAAVKTVAGGGRFLGATAQRLVVEECLRPGHTQSDPDALARLTDRERQILQLIAEGWSRGAIARLLAVRPATVDSHRRSMRAKLDLHNVAQLVGFAMQCGLVHGEAHPACGASGTARAGAQQARTAGKPRRAPT